MAEEVETEGAECGHLSPDTFTGKSFRLVGGTRRFKLIRSGGRFWKFQIKFQQQFNIGLTTGAISCHSQQVLDFPKRGTSAFNGGYDPLLFDIEAIARDFGHSLFG